MRRKLKSESLAEQSARFRSGVQRLIDAGKLNPTDGVAAFDVYSTSRCQRGALPGAMPDLRA
jgi:hypothetical protein